jgi:hypothetical protein
MHRFKQILGHLSNRDILAQLPPLDYLPTAQKGQPNGVASLGSDGLVPLAQLPPLDYLPTAALGEPNGVASLGGDGLVPTSQLPAAALGWPSIWTSPVVTPLNTATGFTQQESGWSLTNDGSLYTGTIRGTSGANTLRRSAYGSTYADLFALAMEVEISFPTAVPTGGIAGLCFLNNSAVGLPPNHLAFGLANSTDKTNIYDSSNFSLITKGDGGSIATGVWHRLGGIFIGSTSRIYYNGVLNGQGNFMPNLSNVYYRYTPAIFVRGCTANFRNLKVWNYAGFNLSPF